MVAMSYRAVSYRHKVARAFDLFGKGPKIDENIFVFQFAVWILIAVFFGQHFYLKPIKI